MTECHLYIVLLNDLSSQPCRSVTYDSYGNKTNIQVFGRLKVYHKYFDTAKMNASYQISIIVRELLIENDALTEIVEKLGPY